MSEEPLHVQVALALGCKPRHIEPYWLCGCSSYAHGCDGESPPYKNDSILRYDTDWSATGPLVEKYGIALIGEGRDWTAYHGASAFEADAAEGSAFSCDESADGPTPLVAVCHLILKLAEAGKL